MANYDNLRVYKTAYDLMMEIFHWGGVQRDIKFTLVQDLKEEVVAIIKLIYKANAAKDKSVFIEEAREKVVAVKLYLRLLCDLRQISEKNYAMVAEKAESISKQLASWQKYQSEKGGGRQEDTINKGSGTF